MGWLNKFMTEYIGWYRASLYLFGTTEKAELIVGRIVLAKANDFTLFWLWFIFLII